jgi:hypothetical protein
VKFYLWSVFLLALVSCSTRQETKVEVSADSVLVMDSVAMMDTIKVEMPKVYQDTLLDNLGKFIAGLSQRDSNSFAAFEKDNYWKEYKASMDTSWNKMYRDRLAKIQTWEASTFSTSLNDSLPVFYPFSGPDFLHAHYLYPHAKEYILAALEPIIEIPPLDTLPVTERDKFLDSLGHSLRDIFNKSYFITTHMKKDLKQIKGVLPALYFFIERSGHELLDHQFISLDSAGHEVGVKITQLHWQKTPGVKITFRNEQTQEVKTLYYFNISISDQGLKERPELIKFINERAPFNTFVKSASYLMHNPPFKMVKELILTNTESLFQDDTGVPYRDFKKRLDVDWQLYGEYTKPVKDFGDEKFQPDLDSLYKSSKDKKDIPFSLGYHWGSKKQNYMLIKKSTVISIQK